MTPSLGPLLLVSIVSVPILAGQETVYPDPAPPKFEVAPSGAAEPEALPFDRLTFHAPPKPLAPNAVTADWPRLLGPTDDVTTPERPLLKTFPASGPAKVWEVVKGAGYTAPAIVGARLVIFHALEGQETVECLEAETGRRFWSQSYPISYEDRLGYANGPRGGPVIAEGRVITLGVTSVLSCLDLPTGQVLWRRDLAAEFRVPQEFFGHGATPLIHQGRLYVNVGGKGEKIDETENRRERLRKLATPGLCVACFDLATGGLLWGVDDEWGASYAAPMLTSLHGQPRLLVFAGGESNPATGGLLCLDPANGRVLERFPWRADMYTSVNATSPLVIPGRNRVFLTTAYPKGKPLGGVMLEFDAEGKAREVWRSSKLACHWMNPVLIDGHLYAIDGETEAAAQLVCVNAESGAEVWRNEITWEADMGGRSYRLSILRASLLRADGAVLCLGETGSLHWLDLSPTGVKETARAQLWLAPHTWSAPAVSRGLLYVAQHESGQDGGPQRFVCYDLRGTGP